MSAASLRIGALARRLGRSRLGCSRLGRSPLGGAAGWSVGGAVAGRCAALASAVLLARILGPTRYGEYALVLSTVMMVSSVATSGVGVAASKYLADIRGADPASCATGIGAVAAIVAAFSCIAGVALWWGAPTLAIHHFARPEMTDLLALGGIALAFAILLGAAQGALNGMERFRASALLGSATAIVLACAVPVCARMSGTMGAVAAWTVVTALGACWASRLIFLAMHEARVGRGVGASFLHEIRRFSTMSLPIVLSAVVMAPVNWIALSLLAKSSSGIAQVGLFNAAYQWYMGLAFIPSVIANAALPLLSRSRSAGDGHGFSALVRAGILANALVACASAALVWLLADAIMGMYGSEYRLSAELLRWLAVAAAANGVNAAIGQVMTASNRLWFGVLVNLLWSAVFLAWVAANVADVGALALAQGLVVAYVLHTLIHLAFLRRHLREARALGGAET